MQYFHNDVNYDFQQAQEQFGYGNVYFVQPPMEMEMPIPAQLQMAQNDTGTQILCEFTVGQITIRIRDGAIFHIFEKHSRDFKFAMGGARDWEMIERNVSSFLKKVILSSSQLLFTDELVTRKDGLLLYVRKPGDRMYHKIALAQDKFEKDVYNLSTAYKLWIDEAVQFAGKWRNFESQQEVYYHPQMFGIFTRTSENSHLANIHHRPEPQPVVENHIVHFVPVMPVPYILVPVQPIDYAPQPQPCPYFPCPPPLYA